MKEWMRLQAHARRLLDAMTPGRWGLAAGILVVAWLVFVPATEAGVLHSRLAPDAATSAWRNDDFELVRQTRWAAHATGNERAIGG